MTTERRINANRKNAQHSTGPRTSEGKAIVARNAVKHGIFSQDIVAVGDDEEKAAFARTLAGLKAALNPEGQMEHSLVEKIAVDTWRLRRTIAHESAVVRHEMQHFQQTLVRNRQKEAGKISKYNDDLVPLEFLKYSDEVTEADMAAQTALIWRFAAADCRLEAEDRALEYTYRSRVEPCGNEDPLPADWRDKAMAHIAQLNASYRGRLRSEIVQREQQVLEEMREVQAVRAAMKTCGPLKYIPPEGDLAKIVKYETMLERNIKRKMDMLHKLQAARRRRDDPGRQQEPGNPAP